MTLHTSLLPFFMATLAKFESLSFFFFQLDIPSSSRFSSCDAISGSLTILCAFSEYTPGGSYFQCGLPQDRVALPPSYFQILRFTESNVTLRFMSCPCLQPFNAWLLISSRFVHGSHIIILDHVTIFSLGKTIHLCGQCSDIGYLGYFYISSIIDNTTERLLPPPITLILRTILKIFFPDNYSSSINNFWLKNCKIIEYKHILEITESNLSLQVKPLDWEQIAT